MIKLLFSINLFLGMSFMLACPPNKSGQKVDVQEETQASDGDAMKSSSVYVDSLGGPSTTGVKDSLDREKKYKKGKAKSKQAPEHLTPEEMKLDSIKKSKKKKKQE